MNLFSNRWAICFTCCLMLSACQTLPSEPRNLDALDTPELRAERAAADAAALAKAAREAELEQAAREAELEQAVGLYGEGDFMQAAEKLRPLMNAPELSPASRVRAIKYMAFSACIQGQRTGCRQFFEEALKLDPDFELAATELSHPIWGTEFKRAQRNTSRNAGAAARAPLKSTP